MVKRGRTERAASAASRTAGTGVGAAAGGFFSNPAVILIALVLGGLFVFRDKISEGIGGIFSGLEFPEIPNPFENFEFPTLTNPFADFEFPEFTFPEFTNPFADFEFPELPDFTSQFETFNEQFTDLFSNFQLQFNNLFGTELEQPPKMVEDTGATQEQIDACQCGSSIVQDAFGNVNLQCHVCEQQDTQLPSQDPALNVPVLPTGTGGGLSDPNFLDFLGLTPAQQFAQENNQQGLNNQGIGFDVPFNDPLGQGGGLSFIGGTTTFGDETNIIDTLSEVLNIFPNLTASQAANALFANPDLTGNQFAQITPIQPSISSSGVDPEQIINNASGGFSGLTPEQIAFILTGGNIQNF